MELLAKVYGQTFTIITIAIIIIIAVFAIICCGFHWVAFAISNVFTAALKMQINDSNSTKEMYKLDCLLELIQCSDLGYFHDISLKFAVQFTLLVQMLQYDCIP